MAGNKHDVYFRKPSIYQTIIDAADEKGMSISNYIAVAAYQKARYEMAEIRAAREEVS